ncbi:MAG: DUF4407 domain-containing protein [Aquimonas sp.]|nr:DUF4407 domain-containing protein [Aquimonas sp.]
MRNENPRQPPSPLAAETTNSRAESWFNRIQHALIWLTGYPPNLVMSHDEDARSRYTSLGLVVACWFMFMLVVWMDTGLHFMGVGGMIFFALVPIMLLGIDRLVMGRLRNPDRELEGYSIAQLQPRRGAILARVGVALVFSQVTTMAFVVAKQKPEIERFQLSEYALANQPLRDEFLRSIGARYDTMRSRNEAAIAERVQGRGILVEAVEALGSRVTYLSGLKSENMMRAQSEQGGLDGARRGCGPRCLAYIGRANQAESDASVAKQQLDQAQARLTTIDREVSKLREEGDDADRNRAAEIASIDQRLREDPRHVPMPTGLFADSSAFLRMLVDKGVSDGMFWIMVMTTAFLFTLELSPLIASSSGILSSSAVDVDRIATSRSHAAAIVARHEIERVRRPASAEVRVRAVQPG